MHCGVSFLSGGVFLDLPVYALAHSCGLFSLPFWGVIRLLEIRSWCENNSQLVCWRVAVGDSDGHLDPNLWISVSTSQQRQHNSSRSAH
ncbi:uncharacterized protein BO88DRAFT_104119 [Aspergillus vadensis CBS 113365]|uniref:Uncharacterized protein n=1 Tax=Aspergillus vadensis (strain CBS 113365 / IMI 142717 / IBT 24658) TaxID=1448311 RepID=A0A319BKI9_ASPVC|nr:hypothetical protein BO88DRAFT_104119 [Aspergillus vadensis CBS 113365]PYH73726.1 hypothetical protein BO88DRAFT_104119 [Aspergillus vadensis CBS 113365]